MNPDAPVPFFVAGGTVPPGSPSYVERAADREVYEALVSGEYCYVLNSRQIGKSSLAVRAIAHLNDLGVRTAFVDLTRIGGATVTLEQWYAGILLETGRALGLRSEAASWLREHREVGPAQRLFSFIQEAALSRIGGPVVLIFDEIDAVRSLGFPTDELFAGLRHLHNGRASDFALRRLTVCLLGSALPSDLIRDPWTTPFNVGRRIELRDFTADEARPFASVLGEGRLKRLLHWTGGHPFLTQALGAELATGGEVDALVRRRYLDARARETDTNLADVARRLLGDGDPGVGDAERANTLSMYEAMLRGKRIPYDEANPGAARIKMSGVARLEGGLLKVRNRVYERAFDARWVRDNMPGQESRRQRRAFWRGALRTGLISTAVLVVVVSLAVVALDKAGEARRDAAEAKRQGDVAREQTRKALAGQSELESQLYENTIESLPSLWNDKNRAEVAAVVASQAGRKDRGWEWGYWRRISEAAYLVAEPSLPRKGGNRSVFVPSEGDAFIVFRLGPGLGAAWLVDGRTGRMVRTLWSFCLSGEEPTMPYARATFSRNGRWAIRTDSRGRYVLQDLVRGTTRSLESREDVQAVSDDGRRFVTYLPPSAREPTRFRLWDAVKGKPIMTGPLPRTFSSVLGISPDGRTVLLNCRDDIKQVASVAALDLESDRAGTIYRLPPPAGVRPGSTVGLSTALGSNGEIVVAVDDRIGVFRPGASKPRLVLRAPGESWASARISTSNDGRWLMASYSTLDGVDESFGPRSRVWDLRSGAMVARLNQGSVILGDGGLFLIDHARIYGIPWKEASPYRTVSMVLSAPGPGEARGKVMGIGSYSILDGGTIVRFMYRSEPVPEPFFVGSYLFYDGEGRLKGRYPERGEFPKGVSSEIQGPNLAIQHENGRMEIRRLADLKLVRTVGTEGRKELQFGADGHGAASLDRQGLLHVWTDYPNGAYPIPTGLDAKTFGPSTLSFSDDGGKMLLANPKAGDQVWDLRTRQRLLSGPPGASLTWGTSGRSVWESKGDGLSTFDFASGTARTLLPTTGGEGSFFAVSPDGRLIARPTQGDDVEIRSTRTGRLLFTLDAPAPLSDPIIGRSLRKATLQSLAFSGDGHRLLAAYDDGTLRTFSDDR